MSVIRPLPARPNLEFERKEAKALIRRLRARDPDSLARARAQHSAIDASSSDRIQLTDAQLVIAREYGFASWPKLVRYFSDVARQRYSVKGSIHTRLDWLQQSVQSILSGHSRRTSRSGRALAAYAPRFYGLRMDAVFAMAPSEVEARLVIARENGFPSWEVMQEIIATEFSRRPGEWEIDPFLLAKKAIVAGDLAELERLVAQYPELLHPTEYEAAKGRNLLSIVLHHEQNDGAAKYRPIIEWLESHGLDLQDELNRQLCGHLHMKPEKVRWLLERGADPHWIAPNGVPVLEHALIRYWNGEAVDLVAVRVRPRSALWIAAGLGDIDGVRRFLDRHGKPTAAARRHRPDFDAVGPVGAMSHPDPEDEEILIEAFFIALLNGRTHVMEYMASRGAPVNSVLWDMPVLPMAVGNGMTTIVESLLRCGADPDLRGRHPAQSAREIAREMLEQMPTNVERRRIAELLGLDSDTILAEREARPAPEPSVHENFHQVLELAGDDAARLGRSSIGPENLLFGLLRRGGLPLSFFKGSTGLELQRLRTDLKDRIRPADDRIERPKLPLDPDAASVVAAAIAAAKARHRDSVSALYLLYALLRADRSPTVELLDRYGSSPTKMLEELDRAI
jgi:hypothetical protein